MGSTVVPEVFGKGATSKYVTFLEVGETGYISKYVPLKQGSLYYIESQTQVFARSGNDFYHQATLTRLTNTSREVSFGGMRFLFTCAPRQEIDGKSSIEVFLR